MSRSKIILVTAAATAGLPASRMNRPQASSAFGSLAMLGLRAAMTSPLADPRVSLLERARDDDVERALAPARLAAIVALERGRVRFTHPLLAATCLAQLTRFAAASSTDDSPRLSSRARSARAISLLPPRKRTRSLPHSSSRMRTYCARARSADRRGRAARARTSLDSGGRAHPLGEEKHDARDVLYHAGDPGIVTGFHHVRLAG